MGILLLAFVLRIYGINDNPKAMYGDELTLAYDAYSILKTGYDSTGKFLPLFFATGGGRPAGYIYATIPLVAFLGPTALAARFVSILSGVGVVLLLYLICSQLFSKKIGIFASFLASITPWELSLSRGAFESHFALFLSLLGLYFFLKSQAKTKWLFVSGLSFALSMQTYSTYVLVIPLFVLLLLFYQGKLKSILSNFGIWLFLALIVSSALFSIYISINRGDKDRFSNLLIFNQPELQKDIGVKINQERAYTLLKQDAAKKFHNRISENLGVLLDNYTRYYSVGFLFLKGDMSPRHNPASAGELYWFCLPLIILGLIYLYQKNQKIFYFLLIWVVLAPLAAVLVGSPHALRSSFLLPPLLIIAACGSAKAKKIKFILILMLIIQLPVFLERFYLLSPNLNAKFWSYSARAAAEVALTEKYKFDFVILSTSIPDMEYAYPVYGKIDPKDFAYQREHKSYFGEYAFSKYGNVYIGSMPSGAISRVVTSLKGSVLYLGPIEDLGKVPNEKVQRDEAKNPLYVISTKEK